MARIASRSPSPTPERTALRLSANTAFVRVIVPVAKGLDGFAQVAKQVPSIGDLGRAWRALAIYRADFQTSRFRIVARL